MRDSLTYQPNAPEGAYYYAGTSNINKLLVDIRTLVERLRQQAIGDEDWYFKWLDGGMLWDRAVYLEKQPWKVQNLEEPSTRGAPSHFEVFFDSAPLFRCLWVTEEGRCKYNTSRKDSARNHVHVHFDYKPFKCGRKCGKSMW